MVDPNVGVYRVVRHFLSNSKYTPRNHFQSVQRATEWRSAVGSTGLSVVGDFLDSMDFDTTEARRNAANDLLEHDRYVYLKTKDVEENGKPVVCVICYICSYAKGIQVKRAGRYRGPLIVFTMAQCWVDFEGSIEVSGFVSFDEFLLAALALSATSVSYPCLYQDRLFTKHRYIVLSGSGPTDTSLRRVMMLRRGRSAVVFSRRWAQTASARRSPTLAKSSGTRLATSTFVTLGPLSRRNSGSFKETLTLLSILFATAR